MRTYVIATITRSINMDDFPYAAQTPDGAFLVKNHKEISHSDLYTHKLVRYNPQDQFCEYVNVERVQIVMETVELCGTPKEI
jgi:hypothetical protein